jgi:hypothetical protein
MPDLRLGQSRAMEARQDRNVEPDCAAVDWMGDFPSARLAMKDKPFQ